MIRYLWIIMLFPVLGIGQGTLTGVVSNSQNNERIYGAVLYWEGSSIATFSDENGRFEIPADSNYNVLICEYTGFATRKFRVSDTSAISIVLQPNTQRIETVEIRIEQPTLLLSMEKVIKTETLTEKSFKKAACCNLSESFETNPTVDVSFTDAVTGTKQIQLLGLAGPYSLITSGNLPSVIGNSAVTGLDFIPGQWLSSVQLIKGSGSVVNGYQSIAGQINTEYKDHLDSNLFLNLYGNAAANTEMNVILPYKLSENNQSTLFVQANHGFNEMDNNNDGFMDNQIGSKVVLMNTFNFNSDSSNWESVAGIKYDYSDRGAGQLSKFNDPYLFKNFQQKVDGWLKLGYVFNKPGRSTGIQLNSFADEKELQFGKKVLNARQKKFYANWIYADIVGNTNHSIKTGITYSYDMLENNLDSVGYGWKESVVGSFLEYNFQPVDQFSIVGGMRMDYSNVFGVILTPRIHGRWEINERNVLRFSGGLGTKNANPFMENYGVFASSRAVKIDTIKQEEAVNTGLNFTKKFKISKKNFSFSTDYYYTYFYNKLITNLDIHSQEINFVNIENGSFAHSFMSQFSGELNDNWEFITAYRWYNVQSKFVNNEYQLDPLNPVHRAFLNTNYTFSDQWSLDYTLSWNGRARIPQLNNHPEEHQLSDYSDAYWINNFQVNFIPSKKWEFYLGAENLLNYQQPNPIVDSDDPFSEYFDASLVWAPVFGRKIYGGLRANF